MEASNLKHIATERSFYAPDGQKRLLELGSATTSNASRGISKHERSEDNWLVTSRGRPAIGEIECFGTSAMGPGCVKTRRDLSSLNSALQNGRYGVFGWSGGYTAP